MLKEEPDWHTVLVNKAIGEGSSVPGEVDDYLALQSATDPEAAFNLFVHRWVHPTWHPHLADSDDNEAEYVRRAIRKALVTAASGGFAAGAAAVGGVPS